VIYDGTVYGMWYSACNSSGAVCQIGYATSKDGITWTRGPNNPILSPGPSGAWDAGGVENQCVVHYNGAFLLYYDGYGTSSTSLNYIGLAQSPPNFVLPETNSPLVVIGVAILIVVAGLSLSRRRRTNRTQS
jgi:LPXTG-motif cell wall-anchored protein